MQGNEHLLVEHIKKKVFASKKKKSKREKLANDASASLERLLT
jgi:hypothetical protein